jgi:hypothetical protein
MFAYLRVMDAEEKLWDNSLKLVKELVGQTAFIVAEHILSELRKRDIAFLVLGGHIAVCPSSYKASATAHAEYSPDTVKTPISEAGRLVEWWLNLPAFRIDDDKISYKSTKHNFSLDLANPQAFDWLPVALDEAEFLKDHPPQEPEDLAKTFAVLRADMPESADPSL